MVMQEPGHEALAAYTATAPPQISSVLTRIEARRALARRRSPDEFEPDLVDALRGINFLPIDAAIVEAASRLDPPLLRSLDAIHLASAISLGPHLDALVTYDRRLAEAARAMGLGVFP